jgi:hypothetical protein
VGRVRGPAGPPGQVLLIVRPGTDVTRLDQDYLPPAPQTADLRRRPIGERAAA